MARKNVLRRGWSLVFAMIALFYGVATLALATVVTQNAQREMTEHALASKGFNLTIIGQAGQLKVMQQAMDEHSPQRQAIGYETPVKRIQVISSQVDEPSAPAADRPGHLARL